MLGTPVALTAAAGSKSTDLAFYQIVPDDKGYVTKLAGVDAGADFGLSVLGPSAQKVHRNGETKLNMAVG